MKKLTTATAIFFLIILTACTPDPTEPVEITRPSTTAVSPTSTPLPASAVPIELTHTQTPTPTPTVTLTPTPSPAPTNTLEPIPFVESDIPYVMVFITVESIYIGPGYNYETIGFLGYSMIAQVTGQSLDGEWWRILCKDETAGNCWLPTAYTVPATAPTVTEMLPDPVTVELASETAIPSPDGRWMATTFSTDSITISDHFSYYYAEITISDGTTTWTPVAEWRPVISGLGPPRLITWSADGRYLYYTQIPPLDGCYYFVNGYYLTRVDTADGSTEEILSEFDAHNLSISPDTAWIAFADGDEGLHIKQLEPLGGHQFILLAEEGGSIGTGEIYWSADSKTIVLTVTSSPCSDFETTRIVRIDIESGTLTTLMASDSPRFFISEWPDPAQPLVRLVAGGGNFWWLNIDTGALTAE